MNKAYINVFKSELSQDLGYVSILNDQVFLFLYNNFKISDQFRTINNVSFDLE